MYENMSYRSNDHRWGLQISVAPEHGDVFHLLAGRLQLAPRHFGQDIFGLLNLQPTRTLDLSFEEKCFQR